MHTAQHSSHVSMLKISALKIKSTIGKRCKIRYLNKVYSCNVQLLSCRYHLALRPSPPLSSLPAPTTLPLTCRFSPTWQPLLSAVTRRAQSFETRQLPPLLRGLERGGAGRDEHLVDAMAARLLEALPLHHQRRGELGGGGEGGDDTHPAGNGDLSMEVSEHMRNRLHGPPQTRTPNRATQPPR